MTNWATLLTALAELLKAIAWPFVVVVALTLFRSQIGSVFGVITKRLEDATSVKAGSVEIKLKQQKVTRLLAQTTKTANEDIREKIPEEQIQAAEEVENILHDDQVSAFEVTYRQVERLVWEYENARNRLPSGPPRTKLMNEIAAKMRALGLAARPLLQGLKSGFTAGETLAAICVLQVAPESGSFDWLIQKIKTEKQPFIFFQAALAVLELVRREAYSDKAAAKAAIEDAREQIGRFPGVPDKNTLDVLNMALRELR